MVQVQQTLVKPTKSEFMIVTNERLLARLQLLIGSDQV